jgi:hypothetical protein
MLGHHTDPIIGDHRFAGIRTLRGIDQQIRPAEQFQHKFFHTRSDHNQPRSPARLAPVVLPGAGATCDRHIGLQPGWLCCLLRRVPTAIPAAATDPDVPARGGIDVTQYLKSDSPPHSRRQRLDFPPGACPLSSLISSKRNCFNPQAA